MEVGYIPHRTTLLSAKVASWTCSDGTTAMADATKDRTVRTYIMRMCPNRSIAIAKGGPRKIDSGCMESMMLM